MGGGSVVLYFAPITSMHVFLSLDESSAFVEVGARELCSWEKEREGRVRTMCLVNILGPKSAPIKFL